MCSCPSKFGPVLGPFRLQPSNLVFLCSQFLLPYVCCTLPGSLAVCFAILPSFQQDLVSEGGRNAERGPPWIVLIFMLQFVLSDVISVTVSSFCWSFEFIAVCFQLSFCSICFIFDLIVGFPLDVFHEVWQDPFEHDMFSMIFIWWAAADQSGTNSW